MNSAPTANSIGAHVGSWTFIAMNPGANQSRSAAVTASKPAINSATDLLSSFVIVESSLF